MASLNNNFIANFGKKLQTHLANKKIKMTVAVFAPPPTPKRCTRLSAYSIDEIVSSGLVPLLRSIVIVNKKRIRIKKELGFEFMPMSKSNKADWYPVGIVVDDEKIDFLGYAYFFVRDSGRLVVIYDESPE